MIGKNLLNYEIKSELGRGGMAVVYKAENTMLGTKVALKVLKEEFVYNKNIRTRFLDEARKMASVKHPNIVQVFDLLDIGSLVAIVMEYVEGKSLKDLIEREGKLDDKTAESLLNQMLSALQCIHQSDYVHRDIKPSNFLLSKAGTIKLSDFGIAKDLNDFSQTTTNTQMGTPNYMSPEQIKSTRDVDQRSDIYSLGVVLFEMVSGRNPYHASHLSLFELQLKITIDPLPNTQTLWDQKIQKATSKDISNRYQTCEEWLNEMNVIKLEHDITLPEIETPTIIQYKPESKKNKEIKSVLINNQRWMSENLNVDTFRNGDLIPEARTNEEWIKLGEEQKPAWCYFDNDPKNREKYGRLYNWFAVNDPRGLAPIGWHIPTDSEWNTLVLFLGGESRAGMRLKSKHSWFLDGNGTDDFSFNGLPGGFRNSFGIFKLNSKNGYWWTCTESILNEIKLRNLDCFFDGIVELSNDKVSGFSIRCIKD